jgi:hypothetical protein
MIRSTVTAELVSGVSLGIATVALLTSAAACILEDAKPVQSPEHSPSFSDAICVLDYSNAIPPLAPDQIGIICNDLPVDHVIAIQNARASADMRKYRNEEDL